MEVRVRCMSDGPYLIRITWNLDPKFVFKGRPTNYLFRYNLVS
jgi:hypothetical protein